MALLNITPFDLNRRPGRPSRNDRQKGTLKTTATSAVSKTPEQRPVVNQGVKVDRRIVERRHLYQPMEKDRRADLRRNFDASKSKNAVQKVKSAKHSIDIKV